MATGTSRDVKLTLSVETLGEENVRKLEDAVSELNRAGGATGPAFEGLLAQIDRLKKEDAAVQTFRELSDATESLRVRQEAAAASAVDLGTKLDVLKANTKDTKVAQAEANAALLAGQKAYTETGNAIRQLKADYEGAQRQTTEYRTAISQLVATQGALKTDLIDLRDAQKSANVEANAAEAAQNKAAGAYRKVQTSAEGLGNALKVQEVALRAAGDEAERFGISTEDVASAQAKLVQSLGSTLSAVEARTAAIRETAESDRLLAIEERTLTDLLQRGAAQLRAEEQAQHEAAQSAREYAAAKEAATAANAKWQQEADGLVAAAEGARQLEQSTTLLLAVERELAAQAAFEKQATDAKGLIQAAEYVRFWEQSLNDADDAAKRLAQEAAASAQKISGAFETLGVRSAESLRAEILQVREAMQVVGGQAGQTGAALNGAFAAGQAKINALERDIRELNGTLTLGDRAAGLFKNSLSQIAGGNIIADGVGYLVNKVKELGVAFVSTIADTERYRRALNAIYKDAKVAGDQFTFLRDVALRSGVAVGDISGSFIKFSAATRSAGVNLQTTNDLFEAVTRAAGTLGLRGEDVTGILEALGQMASKGTVSMEELRQQLGDRLPGALSLVAKGLGITDGQLIKLVESGSLAARDLFPALTTALGSMKGEVTGLTPAFEGLKTVLTQTAQNAGDSGWTQLLTAGLKGITAVAAAIVLPLTAFGEVIFGLAKTAGILTAALVGGTSLKEAFAEISRISQEAAARQTALRDTFKQVLAGTDETTVATKKLAEQTAQTALSTAQLTTATYTSAAAQQIDATAKRLAADNTLDLGAKNVQLGVAISTMLPILEARAEAADKEAKAIKATGAALVAEAELRGNVAEVLATQAAAATNNVAAAEKELAARQAETEVLTIQRNAIIVLSQASAEEAVARKAVLDLTDKKLVKSQAETEQAKAALAVANQENLARKIAIETYGDQSAKVDEFRVAMQKAGSAAAQAAIAQVQGKITLEQYKAASEAATLATAKYNNALSDVSQKIQAQSTLEQANYQVKLAGLSVAQKAYEQLAQAATASGDYAGALYNEINAKRLQIQITELQAKAARASAEAARLGAEADLAALKVTDAGNVIKKLEIEARLANAKAKELEAGASEIVIRGLNAEIDAINSKFRVAQQERDQRGSNISSINSETDARLSNASSIDAQTAALQKKKGVDAEGFTTDKSGARLTAGGDLTTRTGIVAFLKAAGVNDDGAARKIANEFADNQGNVQYFGNAGQVKYGGRNGTISSALLKAAEQYTFNPKNAASSTVPKQADSSKTINVNINGKSQSFKVSSDADAATVTSILRQLESEANRSS